jgi:hypothetical protein
MSANGERLDQFEEGNAAGGHAGEVEAIRRPAVSPSMISAKTEGVNSMGKKEREDEPTKEFKKAVKAEGKPPKKEKKKLDKITKHLSKNEKI